MPTTIINVDAVNDSTARAIKQIQNQKNSLDEIDGVISSMEEAWESEAQRTFADKFRELKTKILNFTESIDESLKGMNDFVSECVRVDEQTARELRNISW